MPSKLSQAGQFVSDHTPTPKERPAEFGGVAGSIALLVGYALGIEDPGVLASIGAVIGAIPAGITWVVELRRH